MSSEFSMSYCSQNNLEEEQMTQRILTISAFFDKASSFSERDVIYRFQ